jgi:hypothetical protein
MNVEFQQQVNIKFCVKLGKTATESLQLLHDACGDEALCWVQVFAWHRRFVSGRVSVEDDTRSCWPSSSCSEDNMAWIRDHTVTVCMLVGALNITVFQNPHPPLASLHVISFCFRNWKKDTKRMVIWEYRGYWSGCDNGAHSHTERGIHQLLPGLAKTLATVYWLRRELLWWGQEPLVHK